MTYSFEKVSFELFDQLEFIQVDCLPTNKKVPFKHMTCNKPIESLHLTIWPINMPCIKDEGPSGPYEERGWGLRA